MRTRHLANLGMASTILIALALSPAVASAARSAAVDWPTTVRDTADLSGPVIASGSVRDARGRPASGQAVLLAFPPQDVLSTMKVGDSVDVVPVGKARVGADGAFALRWDPLIPIDRFTSSFGTVDLEVLVDGPAGASVIDFSREVAPDGSLGAAANEPGDGRAAGEVALILDPGLGSTRRSRDVRAAATVAAAPIYCTNTLEALYPPVWHLVAELYTGSHATVDFTYAVGTQSTLGVGLSVSGSAGSFSQSGKITVGSTGSINFAEVPQNQRRVEETQWRYGKWDVSCPTAPHYEARPHSWIGGSTYYSAASTPLAPYCTPYQIGDRPSIDQHQAIEWSNGVRISGIIGVDLSSTTGFTSKAAQKWTFRANGKLCGTNAYPFQARTIVAK
ncbi:MAG TPA: hypothetical protein VGQ02_00970 [Candidatus Limnocylindrales bacterium]|jgi:hypothetical protein|nr:hypothetical protein [Candidatus Limnocylindrales bacterium]